MKVVLYVETYLHIKGLGYNIKEFVNQAIKEYKKEMEEGKWDLSCEDLKSFCHLSTDHPPATTVGCFIYKPNYDWIIDQLTVLGLQDKGYVSHFVREAVDKKVKKEKLAGRKVICRTSTNQINLPNNTIKPGDIVIREGADAEILESSQKPKTYRSLTRGQEMVKVTFDVPIKVDQYISANNLFYIVALAEGVRGLLKKDLPEIESLVRDSKKDGSISLRRVGSAIPQDLYRALDEIKIPKIHLLRVALELFVTENQKGMGYCKDIFVFFLFDPTKILWDEKGRYPQDKLCPPYESEMEDCKGDSKYKWITLICVLILIILSGIYYLIK